MIDMPKDVVVRKILEQTELSEQEIEERIREKLKQLSGFISEGGAVHIVANELGVQLYKTEGPLKISELTTAAKNAVAAGRVLKKYEVREFDVKGRKGRVANAMIGDDSGRIRLVFWNEHVDLWEKLKEGDTLRIRSPFVKENNGRYEIHLNERSQIDVNPPDLAVAPPKQDFGDRPERELKYLRDLTGQEEEVEVLGTIVQVYEPRFFDVCPECNRRVNDKGHCPQHGEVIPTLNYVTTCFLDDGTANVRTTFWKQQSQRLFGLSDDDIRKWKDDPTASELPRHELLGEIIKIVGRAKRNEQFDRLELTADLVFKDVDPEQELAKLEKKAASAQTSVPSSAPVPAPATSPALKASPVPSPADSSTTTAKTAAPASSPSAAVASAAASRAPPRITTDDNREVKPEDVAFSNGDEIESISEEEVISIEDL